MIKNIIDYESIPTRGAYEIELRVRAREEQRFMQEEDWDRQEARREKRTSNPIKVRLAGFFSSSKGFLRAVIDSISH